MKVFLFCSVLLAAIGLTGCAGSALNAPCPNFGDSCHQTPVNGWDDTTI